MARFRIGWIARFAVVLLVVIVAYLQAQDPREPIFPVDDAYITEHNATALLHGHDTQFPESTPLHGATSVLHTVLVAAFAMLLSPDWALYVATWFAIGLYAWGVLELCKSLECDAFRGFLVVATTACFGRSVHQLTNGLETGLTMASIAWTLALETRKDALERGTGPALMGALPFVRPELVAFGGLCLLMRTVRRFVGARRTVLSGLLRDARYFLSVLAPLMAVLSAVTGSVVPSTVEAKKMFFAEGCWDSARKREMVVTSFTNFCRDAGPMAWLLPLLLTSFNGVVCAGFAAVLVFAYFHSFPGALAHYEGRYLYVLAPMAIFALAYVMSARLRIVRWAAGAFALWCIRDAVIHYDERSGVRSGMRDFTAAELEKPAAWVREHLSDQDVLMVHDAGYISAKTDAHLVDLVGLKTPSSVSFHETLTWPTCGHKRGAAIYAIARDHAISHLLVLDVWDRIFNIVGALRVRGWNVEEVGPDGAYSIYRVTQSAVGAHAF